MSSSQPYILAIDQGTTGTTVIILNRSLEVHARVNREFPQIYPRPGWVEHDPEQIWATTLTTIREALASASLEGSQIAAIGITNQRETTVIWERATGKPIHNAIVWQDRRTAPFMRELRDAGHADEVKKRTGLVLDPYFSASKAAWMLDQVPGARARAEKGELAFGTIDTFLLWNLTRGASHATDVSNASRTLLMNLETQTWDEELLRLFNVPRAILPDIQGNAEVFGEVRGVAGLSDGTPVSGMAGDQQAALFGQACFNPGEAKCTYGTGAFLLMNTGDEIVYSDSGMLTTAGWRLGDEVTYALEGSAFIAGAAVQWLRDGLGLINSSADIEHLAGQVEDSGGVVFVPALTGLGAPHWNPDARGVIHGITRGTTRAHIARATLEGIAFQNVDILKAMEQDLGRSLEVLKVDGGASANGMLMQFQADTLGCPIIRPEMTDTTALGSALLAGLAVGIFSDLGEIREAWKEDARFDPVMGDAEREAHLARWSSGLSRV
ncbi:MAG: glycerol kinase [Myxococcales bacterium]|nr:glycerol kinase [Myxococcales bacterium]